MTTPQPEIESIKPTVYSMEKAAQAWCQPNTKHIVMDVDLGIEFAHILDSEIESLKAEIERLKPYEEYAKKSDGLLMKSSSDRELQLMREINGLNIELNMRKAQQEVMNDISDQLVKYEEVLKQCVEALESFMYPYRNKTSFKHGNLKKASEALSAAKKVLNGDAL